MDTTNPQGPMSTAGGPQPVAVSDPVDRGALTLSRAIALQESGQNGTPNYQATGDNGTSYGAYQWNNGKKPLQPGQLPVNFTSAAKQYGLDPADFSPENQDKVAYAQVKALKDQGLSPEQIAASWNAGMGHINDWQTHKGVTDINGQQVAYDTPHYVANVQQYYGQLASQDPQMSQQAGGELPAPTPDAGQTYNAPFPLSPGDNGLVAGFKALGNLPTSMYGVGAGLVNLAMHPLNTAQNLGSAAIGGVENLTGENKGNPDQNQQNANAFGQALMNRYGSLDALAHTATNDPFGFGSDVVSLLAGGAGLIGKGAELGELGSRLASPITRLGGKLADATVGGGALPDVAAASARAGVELPAAAYTRNPIVNAGEALAATGGGEAAYSARVDSSLAQMESVAQNIVKSAGGAGDLATAGERVAQGLADYESAFKNANDTMFSEIKNKIGDVAGKTEQTTSILHSIVDGREAIADTAGLKFFKDKLDVVNGAEGYKPPTLDTLKKLRTNVGEKIGSAWKDPTANVGELKRLYGALSQDMRSTIVAQRNPEVLALYDKANAAYKAGYEVISSQYANKIRKLSQEGQESKIVDTLIKSSTAIEDIPRILRVAGPQGAREIQSSLLQRIFDDAKDIDGNFTPLGIKKALKKIGDNKLGTILTPEQIQQVQDLGTLTESMKNVLALQKGASPQFLVKMALQFRTLGEPAALAWAGWNLLSGDVIGAVEKLGGVIGVEGTSRFLASNLGNKLLKWGALHGTDFAKVSKAQGVAPPAEYATMHTNGNNTGTNPGDSGGSVDSAGSGSTDGNKLQQVTSSIAPAAVPLQDLNGSVGGLQQNSVQLAAPEKTQDSPYLTKLAKVHGFDLEAALNAGYQPQEIQDFLENLK